MKPSYGVDCRNGEIVEECTPTLQSVCYHSLNGGGVVMNENPEDYIARRLIPVECARLQGMPDNWCDKVPHKDAAEYKLWGNGMAFPCILYVVEGATEILKRRQLARLLGGG